MKNFVFVAILTVSQIAYAHANNPQFQSLANSFRKFIAESSGLSIDDQIKAWVNNVESQAPEAYLHIIANGDKDKLESERRVLATKWFPILFTNSSEIQKQFDFFEAKGKPVIETLARSYPEANLNSVIVMALPSLNKFNGKVATIDGRIYVLFGMDMIALINSKPDLKSGAVLVNDLPVLMSHEFTHALHYLLSDFGSSDLSVTSFWGPLWDEGLAQVNSQLLNPGADLPSVFMEKILASKCTPENIKTWAKAYIDDSKSDEQHIESVYNKWFMMSAGLEEFGTYRAGYCLGYNVVLNALRSYSMKEVIKMSRADAYRLSQEALSSFALDHKKGKMLSPFSR